MKEVVKERLRSLRDALMAFSLANLCFIWARSGLLFENDTVYYKQLALSRHALLALALNITLFGVVGWRLARWVRRAQSRLLYRAACAVIGGLLFIPFDFLRVHYFGLMVSQIVPWIKNPFLIGSGLVLLFVVWRWPRRALHVLAVVPMILVPSVFITFGKIGYRIAKCRPDTHPKFATLYSIPKPAAQPRVIWIIFDETDQRLAFSNRPKDCLLPELDRLCAESLQATNALPPGGSTLFSLPALITGRYIVKAQPATRSELNITYGDTNAPVGWSTQPTVFSRARELGFNTAVVGWFHPYSRLFASCLNFCTWYPYPGHQANRDTTLLRSMITQIWSWSLELQERRLMIDHYRKSLEDSRGLVKDGRYGLVMLHLPGAHFPGIYNSTTGRLTLTSFSRTRGYFQNLQLTDKTMGILRRDMEQAGQWDRSWVIVSSDHWWRDARLYDGQLDYHIPFILKAPGRNPPITYSSPLNTVITKELILAILRKEVSTISEAVAWIDTHKPPPCPSYFIMDSK